MERVYTIPLREAFDVPRTRRSNKAVKVVREFLEQHTKATEVKLDATVNEAIWNKGREKPPRKIKVKVVKEDDIANVTLVEE